MPRCLLALGANLGNREETLRSALSELAALPRTRLLARSTWHETPAVGGPAGQHSFLNGAVLVDTNLEAQELADRLQKIELHHGRERKVRWSARTLDIDLLLYGGMAIDEPLLTIPHPRMTFRRFVLAPAAEIAGHMVVPLSGWTIASLLNHLSSAANYVAIEAADPQVAEWLATQLCERLQAPRLEDFFPSVRVPQDSRLQSVVKWQNHEELLNRLPSHNAERKSKNPPVIGGFWHPAGTSECLTDFVHPALVISVVPPGRLHELPCRASFGPLARITAATPEVMLDETLAAIVTAFSD